MVILSPEPLTLHGGCFCRAIRYTINILGLEHRPILPGAVDTRLPPHLRGHEAPPDIDNVSETVPTKFPVIPLDHCETCRSVSGGIIQCWIISPLEWVKWDLLPRVPNQKPSYHHPQAASDGDDRASPVQNNPKSEIRWLDIPSIDVVARETKMGQRTGASTTTGASTENTYMNYLHSTEKVTRTFCSRCGTNLSFFYDRPASSPVPPIVDIAVGSLDAESLSAIHPDRHNWWASGVPWVQRLLREGDGGLMRHPTGSLATVAKD
ncbi:hypothetical protein FQN54_005161 [Arachnomyces sp. PD_36]|nr:hypothetical protein FQN54_005161 [Arachnomyces sp. PD_36]